MWGPQIEEIILRKGEKGLGFSILDYQVSAQAWEDRIRKCSSQDPANLTDTVIVVRGLVPGGAAQLVRNTLDMNLQRQIISGIEESPG